MKRSLSSIGLHSFQGIRVLPQMRLCVNHVSGTFCKLCVEHYNQQVRSIPPRHKATDSPQVPIWCPLPARVWRGKPYANIIDDCMACRYALEIGPGISSITCAAFDPVLREQIDDLDGA